jgi:hypothetical protein
MSATHGHTGWCAGGHRCTLAEHRSHPVTLAMPGAGRAVLTRVRGADGTEYAEIRLRVELPAYEPHARMRLVSLLTHLRTLIGPARTGDRPHRGAA